VESASLNHKIVTSSFTSVPSSLKTLIKKGFALSVKQTTPCTTLILTLGYKLIVLLPSLVLEKLLFYRCSLQVEIFNGDIYINEAFFI
jgi:hypothetical protein